jgi:hypothetical protein
MGIPAFILNVVKMKKFKKSILNLLFDYYDKFYIHVAPLKSVVIGKRGLVGEEQENGLVLVFGANSYKALKWDDEYMYVDMRFSGKWETVQVPFDAIVAAFDEPSQPSFIMRFTVAPDEVDVASEETKKTKKESSKSSGRLASTRDNVVKIDFSKKDE